MGKFSSSSKVNNKEKQRTKLRMVKERGKEIGEMEESMKRKVGEIRKSEKPMWKRLS